MTPKEIWEQHQHEAEWEGYDRVDDYCLACSIHLEVDGHIFDGEGQIVGGVDHEIESIECACPDGTLVKII